MLYKKNGREVMRMEHYRLYLNSPIGILEVQTDDERVVSINLVAEKKKASRFTPLIMRETYRQLKEYFDGKRLDFDLKLLLEGTEFQKSVWNELLKIPCGHVTTYKGIAQNLGNGKASRAVGNANNKNKILIVVPCHRVVGSDGKLNGYREGAAIKEWLINHEQRTVNNI